MYVNHPLLIEIDEYMCMSIYMDICVSVYMFMCTSLLYPVVSLGRKVKERQRNLRPLVGRFFVVLGVY